MKRELRKGCLEVLAGKRRFLPVSSREEDAHDLFFIFLFLVNRTAMPDNWKDFQMVVTL